MSFDVCGINDLILAEVTSFFIIHIGKKGNLCEKSGEFSPLNQMARENAICTTREIVAQNRQVGLGALCTAWTVASELEGGFASTFFFCLDGQDMAALHATRSRSTMHAALPSLNKEF